MPVDESHRAAHPRERSVLGATGSGDSQNAAVVNSAYTWALLRRLTTLVFAALAACVYATAPGGSVAALDSRADFRADFRTDFAPGDTGQGLLRGGGEDHAAVPVTRSEARVGRPIEGRRASRVPGGGTTTPVGSLSLGRPPLLPDSEAGLPWPPAAAGTRQPESGGRSSRGPPPRRS